MTREEEITNACIDFKNEELPEGADLSYAFFRGAKWADENPINYDGKAMLYVNERSHDNGYKEAVDKAAEWLFHHLYPVEDKNQRLCHVESLPQMGAVTLTEFLEQFKKAMEQ